jgi:hypothetical protein
MPPHQLPKGLQVIEGLEILAQSLEYHSAREHAVGSAGAAVDLAWFCAGDERVPLMIFEIESSASASMANNALKVFSQDVDDFVKPLFFFHILLDGGPDNERISALRRGWGTHNYRVYRMNDESEAQRLVSDILGQHRRVSANISLLEFFSALRFPAWAKVNLVGIFEAAERLHFSTNYIGDLARLAGSDPLMQPLFATRLREEHVEAKHYPGIYDGYLGQHFSSIIEISLLAGNANISDEKGAELLAEWQRKSRPLSMIGPHFGLSRDYDHFVLSSAPFAYAVAAILCRGNRLMKSWLANELSALIDGEEEAGVRVDYTAAARIWLLHITASTLRDFSSSGQGHDEADLHEIFSRTRTAMHIAKVPIDLIRVPPNPWELMEFIEEGSNPLPIGVLSGTRLLATLLEWQDVTDGYFPEIEQGGWPQGGDQLRWRDSFELATTMLTGNEWTGWPTNQIIRLLHGEPFPGEHSSAIESPNTWTRLRSNRS